MASSAVLKTVLLGLTNNYQLKLYNTNNLMIPLLEGKGARMYRLLRTIACIRV